MSSKNIFLKFFQGNQPKGASGRRVVGERGSNDLPPGKKGGETMTPDRHYEHKQHAFDSFCKKVLKCEAYNGYREISRRQSREVAFSELPEDSMEQLASYEALNALPQDGRDILLMYFFLDMADREIAERMNMARRTVNARRQKAYRLLKELMGGDVDG